MANGFGSLWVGTSGLQSASHALNTTANNLSNVNTEGYVREQVVFEDRSYLKIGTASISVQRSGLGVDVGTIVHARDIFLDQAYRTEGGRYSFYSASSEAVQEVQTYLQEMDGKKFQEALEDFYGAFAEFAKDPSDTTNQDLVMQKASLFLSRSQAVETGFEDYQTIINQKITDDVNRVNEIGNEIVKLNKRIQAIEAGKVEKAMDLRDKRDLLLDELSGLCRMSYHETVDGIVKVEIEGVEFIDEMNCNNIGLDKDLRTGFVTPYWPRFSDIQNEEYYPVFSMENISAEQGSDLGEIKALLLARGDHQSGFLEFYGVPADRYEAGIGNSVMLNSQAELDTLIHKLVTTINDLYSPIDQAATVYGNTAADFSEKTKIDLDVADDTKLRFVDEDGNDVGRVCDIYNADVGSDGELPPRELFVRNGTSRYTTKTIYVKDQDGNNVKDAEGNDVTVNMYVYNEETMNYTDRAGVNRTVFADGYTYYTGDTILDTSCCYALKNISVNEELVENRSNLPHKKFLDQLTIDYELGDALEKMWTNQEFHLNPADTTPCSFGEFYTKWIGEIATTGSVYETTTTSLEGTKEQIDFSRQGVIGVSSDEELTNMIKYQSAYNASSRFINVINEMIEHIVTSLGHI